MSRGGRLLLAALTLAAAALAVWWNHEGQWMAVWLVILAYLVLAAAVRFGDYILRAIRGSAARIRAAERRDHRI